MRITADTNVLVRAMTDDNPRQGRIARDALERAEMVALTSPTLCELAWVLSRGYKMGWGLGRHTIEVYAYFEGPHRLPIEYIAVVGEDWKPDVSLPHWDTFPERTPELNAAMSRIPFQ